MKTAEKQGRRTSLSFPAAQMITTGGKLNQYRRCGRFHQPIHPPAGKPENNSSFLTHFIHSTHDFSAQILFHMNDLLSIQYPGGTLYLSSMGSIEFLGHNIQLLIYVIITSIPCFFSIQKTLAPQGLNLYPTPQMVRICFGSDGSSSTASLRRLICTGTVDVFPKESMPQILVYRDSLLNTTSA